MKLLIYLLAICFTSCLAAQGIHFTDNREVPIQLNPAYAGIIHKDYVHRFVVSHRRQGNTILEKNEFETYYASYDHKVGLCGILDDMFMGIGFDLFHDQVGRNGKQFFHRQTINLNTSVGIKLNDASFLVAGLSVGALSHGLSKDNLTFDSQYDGRDYNASLPTLEGFSNERLFHFDMGAGLLLRGAIDYGGVDHLLQVSTYELGISAKHINSKKENFLINSSEVRIEEEYRVHTKLDLLINSKLKITPSFILYKYGALNSNGKEWQMRPSLEFPILRYWMLSSGMRISNFAEKRSNIDALVFTLKWKPYIEKSDKDNMIIGLSFDINVSPHQVGASKHYGAFEFFAAYYFTAGKKKKTCCPWDETGNQVFY